MSGLANQGPLPPDNTHAPVFVGVLSTFFILSTLFVFLRVYTRIWTLKGFWWDDGVLVLAFICGAAEYATQMVQVAHGYGRRAAYVDPGDITLNLKIGYVAQLLWVWTCTLVKTSVCLQLLRVRPTWFWGMAPLAAFQIVVGLGTTVIHFLRCSPIKANWYPTLPQARCWLPKDISTSYYVLSALFVVCDFIFAILPISFIYKIRRPLREKIILVFLMGCGLFASACAIAKMALISLNPITDPTYDPIELGIWAHLEQFVGIIAACVPCLKAPFERVLVHFGLLTRGDSKYSTFSKYGSTGDSDKDPNMRLNKVENSGEESDELASKRQQSGGYSE